MRLRDIFEQLATEERVVLLRVAAARLHWPTPHIEVEDVEACTRTSDVEFIHLVASRLLWGQEHYGRLSIATDPRDWKKEAIEEEADLVIYRAIDAISRSRAPWYEGEAGHSVG